MYFRMFFISSAYFKCLFRLLLDQSRSGSVFSLTLNFLHEWKIYLGGIWFICWVFTSNNKNLELSLFQSKSLLIIFVFSFLHLQNDSESNHIFRWFKELHTDHCVCTLQSSSSIDIHPRCRFQVMHLLQYIFGVNDSFKFVTMTQVFLKPSIF